MTALIWNFEKQDYDPYELPEGSLTFAIDMDTICSCASCGKKMPFGDGYTSRKIHTKMGMGFSVCSNCYAKECEEEKEYDARRQTGNM